MQYWRERKIKLITWNELQKMCLACLYPPWCKLIPAEAGTLKSYHIFFSLILPPDFAILKYTELLNAIHRESKHKNLVIAVLIRTCRLPFVYTFRWNTLNLAFLQHGEDGWKQEIFLNCLMQSCCDKGLKNDESRRIQ
jgi:hypothetical protein